MSDGEAVKKLQQLCAYFEEFIAFLDDVPRLIEQGGRDGKNA
jgi:hypothetical protein